MLGWVRTTTNNPGKGSVSSGSKEQSQKFKKKRKEIYGRLNKLGMFITWIKIHLHKKRKNTLLLYKITWLLFNSEN